MQMKAAQQNYEWREWRERNSEEKTRIIIYSNNFKSVQTRLSHRSALLA